MTESHLSDTSAEAMALKVERLRAMSYAEKAALVDELNRAVQRMAEAGARCRHPDATDREVLWVRSNTRSPSAGGSTSCGSHGHWGLLGQRLDPWPQT